MKKTIYNKYDKNRISSLPQVLFGGRVVVVISVAEAERAVDWLLSQDILGVDTETRPSFRRGSHYKVSLLQVATREVCFLFRLNDIGVTPAVKRLLEDRTVPKVGLSWHDDIRSLKERADFQPGWFIDLQDIVGELGIKDLSLQKLYANLFGQKISKRERLSNWEADSLSPRQQGYAATDAWACIMLYEEIQRLKATHDYELEIVPEPEVRKEDDGGDKPADAEARPAAGEASGKEGEESTAKPSRPAKTKRRKTTGKTVRKTAAKPRSRKKAGGLHENSNKTITEQ